MREALLKIFGTSEGSLEITLFSIWHILYIIAIIAGTFLIYYLARKKDMNFKEKILRILAYLVIGVYIADFFIQPFTSSSYQMDVDKLPFHICTLTSIFIPFAQFNKKFSKIKDVICCLSIVSSLMYITYPGSALGGVAPYSYKVIQTFVFHGLMFAWGVLSVLFASVKFEFKNIWKELVAIIIVIIWANFGNNAYSNEDHHYDWFFITGSTFPFIPSWLMPFVVLCAVYGMCAIIFSIDLVVKKIIEKRKLNDNNELLKSERA